MGCVSGGMVALGWLRGFYMYWMGVFVPGSGGALSGWFSLWLDPWHVGRGVWRY